MPEDSLADAPARMTRAQQLVASLTAIFVLAMLPTACATPAAVAPSNEQIAPLPSKVQLGWQRAELGVLVSYDLHTFGDGRYNQRLARITPIKNIDRFAPEQLDTDQWIRAVKAAGAGESARPDIAANSFELLKRGDPNGTYWLPAMSDAPLRGHGGHEWFWEPADERLLQPLPKLVDMYCRSVGHNSTLILGLTPDTRGRMPDADVTRLAEFGATIDRMFGHPLAATATTKVGNVIELPFEQALEFDLIVLQEDIELGERVRKYELQVHDGDWRTIATGSCIGNKRIHRLPERHRGDAVRLRVLASRGAPRIQHLSVHRQPQ